MNRVFFNGVSSISSDGKTISFVFDDTYQTKTGLKKTEVIELISNIDDAEKILTYLISEINNIRGKSAQAVVSEKGQTSTDESFANDESTLGIRIEPTDVS